MNETLYLLPQPQILKLRKNAGIKNGFSEYLLQEKSWKRLQKILPESCFNKKSGRKIRVLKDSSIDGNDAYEIELGKTEIIIRAKDETAAFYGICTLKQLNERYGLSYTGQISDWADLKLRILMIDLKRVDWNFNYLLSLIERAAELKINYIMIEYEDKFKYKFSSEIPVKSALNIKQIEELNRKAFNNFVEIIPLVQCLAHYEYILKYDKFKELRENPDITSQACPLKAGTFELFRNMASEIMEAHPDSRYFHIGADEPFLLGTCPECAMQKGKNGNGKLYSDYLNKVFDWVESKGRIPVFWADIIRHYPDAARRCSKKALAVDWNYGAKKIREKEVLFSRHGLTYLNMEHYEKFSPEQKKETDKCWETDLNARDFLSLPYGKIFKDYGYPVLGGSNINSVDNVLTHSENAFLSKLEGNLATYWASSNSLTNPYTVYETRLAGICMLAASSWNTVYERKKRNSFFERAFFSKDKAELFKMLDNKKFIMLPMNSEDECREKIKDFKDNKTDTNQVRLLKTISKKINLERKLNELKKTLLKKPLLEKSRYKFIDISGECNTRFSDTPEIPGWTGEGSNDERFFPQGKVCFNGVPFNVIKETPDNKTVLFFGNDPGNPAYSQSVEIPVNVRIYSLNFLHSLCRGKADTYGYYKINYEDGGSETVEIKNLINIGAWWNIMETARAPVAVRVKNLYSKRKVGFHTFSYLLKNQHKKVKSVELNCSSRSSLFGVCAITAVLCNRDREITLGRKSFEKLETLKKGFLKLEKAFRKELPEYLSENSANEMTEKAIGPSIGYIERKSKGLA
ncbi:MAG: hypothetical protein A2017_15815 [Lentisphaerae bacterium GWF2_44_16]|nr:MAG: hypothetical protein A2017_15815 [Lentisphaerae bacterium GWF2_44_16]